MLHLGPEPPWTERIEYRDGWMCSYGEWVSREPLWDGTPVWEYVANKPRLTFLELLSRLPERPNMTPLVRWLEDAAGV
jgi:hypothetical protein